MPRSKPNLWDDFDSRFGPRFDGGMPALTRQKKITFGEMRAAGVRGLLIYCSDYRCSHWTTMSADRWPHDVRLSDLERKFVCRVCGTHGADIRPESIETRSSPTSDESGRHTPGLTKPLDRAQGMAEADVRAIRGEVPPALSLHTSVGCVGDRTDKQNCALYTILFMALPNQISGERVDLLVQIARCRRLAKRAVDEATAQQLLALAAEHEEQLNSHPQ